MDTDDQADDRAPAKWSVYLIRCGDGSLYTGISTNPDRRLSEHAEPMGRGARYLRGRGPLELVFVGEAGSRAVASRLEYRIKRLTRSRKEQLIAGDDCFRRLLACATGEPQE